MKTLIIGDKETAVTGRARALKQERFDRAVMNSVRPGFNSKFTFPRNKRPGANQKP